MKYEIVSRPVLTPPSSTKIPKWKREQLARRAEQVQEMSIEEAIACGAYNSHDRPHSWGVQLWERELTLSDGFGPEGRDVGEWYSIRSLTIGVSLPRGSNPLVISRILKPWGHAENVYSWGNRAYCPKSTRYAIFNLLGRILDLPYFDTVPSVPIFVRTRIPAEKIKAVIGRLNNGERMTTVSIGLPPHADKLTLNQLRHNYTPYDYEWQTGLQGRDKCQEKWNAIIRSLQSCA